MNRFKIGIVAESTGLSLRSTIEQAARWGVEGLQVDGIGDLSANRLTETGRREFRNLLRSYNLELAAIACPLRRGLDTSEDQQKRIENIQNAMHLAYDLGARKVIVPFPKLPEAGSPAASILRESLLALSSCGDRVGTVVCLDTGLNTPADLKAYLGTYDTGCLTVAFDPASHLMNGHDPFAAMMTLSNRISYAFARDAKRLAAFSGLQEVPLGAGEIDWMLAIATLEAIDYRGYLTIKRTAGDNRLTDLLAGVQFLRRFVPREDR